MVAVPKSITIAGNEYFIVEKEGGLNPEVVKVLEAKGFIVEKPFTYYRTSILWGDKAKEYKSNEE